MKKKNTVHIIKDPKLTDRQLMIFLLFQVGKIRCDAAVITNLLREKGPVSDSVAKKIFEFCDQQAFEDLQTDIRHFELQCSKGTQN